MGAPAAADDSRWSVTGRLGRANAKRDFGPPGLGWSIDGEDLAASFEVGYAPLHHLAVQAGYHYLGAHRGQPRPCLPGEPCPRPLSPVEDTPIIPAHPARAELSGYSLSLVPRWWLSERLSVHGKVGYLGWKARLSRLGDAQPLDDPSESALLLGAGARYALPSGFGIVVEYESSDLGQVLGAGATWRF